MSNILSKVFSILSTDQKELSKRPRLSSRSSEYKKAQHYVFELLHTIAIETRAELVTKIILTSLILLNLTAVILETIPSLQEYSSIFTTFETITVVVFTLEYILRVWSIVDGQKYNGSFSGRLKYCLSFYSLIDLLAILPFYLPVLIGFDLRFIRSLRLLRLLRILKLGQYSNSLGMLYRVATKKKYDIAVSLSIILLLIIFAGCMLYFLEHDYQPEVVSDIPTTIWWGLAKLTALGYVEIIPVSIPGKVCDALLSFLGLSFFALPSGILAAGFVEEIESRKRKQNCPHCGKEIE